MVLNNLLIFSTLAALAFVLIGRNWQMRIAGLAVVYLVGFILILQIWPLALVSVKLIAGWIGIVFISASKLEFSQVEREKSFRSETIFRLLIVFMLWIVIIAIAPTINEWIPIPYTNLYIGLSMIATGIVFSSLTTVIFEIIIGVLTFLAGFDIIYSSLEGSALVTGIFALIIILISLLNTYFMETTKEVFS